MMRNLQDISERIKEIKDFAKENDNEISLFVVQDIIKNKKTGIDEDLLNEALYYLEEEGIRVLPLDMDEGYKAEAGEPDKFIPSDVNITQVPISISNIMERLENDEYDLAPAFQRHGDLWDKEKQSQLIESLMLKIPLPAFYFDASKEDKWIVIDGLQRLTVFKNYLVGNIQADGSKEKHKFKGMQYLKDFNGKTFDEGDIQRVTRQFVRVMNACKIVFGKYAFRKYNENFRRGPINKAIFEIWAICFSELDDRQLEKIERNREEFVKGFGKILADQEFVTTLKAGDFYSFIKRIDVSRQFVKEFL